MSQDQRRILLVEPPFYRLFKDSYALDKYPLSLGYLAGELKQKTTWDVLVYNADFRPQNETIKISHLSGEGFENYLRTLNDPSAPLWSEIKQTIAEYNPTVVGISAKSQNFTSALRVAGLAREINPSTVVIMGGPHPTTMGADILRHQEVDICVRGEGETTLTEIVGSIDRGASPERIRGIVFRKDGEIVETPPRDYIEDLDSLSFPHQHAPDVLKDYHQYPVTAFKTIFATRGCPYNCVFCGSRNIWSRKVRFRSPENVVRQIQELQKTGLKFIHFDDDTFGVNRKYLTELCTALISHCPGLKWSCEIHPRLVDEQNLSLMKAAGCYSVRVGIESGNNEILKAMRKRITIEQALQVCRLIRKQKIDLQVFFIVGFPQETEETLRDTMAAIKKVRCNMVIYSIFTPYPGTEAFEMCKEYGLIDEDYDVSLYNHQSPANQFCRNIAPQRFRELVSELEKSVDRLIWRYRIKDFISVGTLKKIQEMGIGMSVRKGMQLLVGK